MNKRTEPDLEGFWKQLDEAIDTCAIALLERFEWQGKQLAKSAPFLYENELLLCDRKLKPEESVRDALKHGTLAIGWIGLSNTLVALFGKHHGESPEVQEFGLKIANHINERAKEYSEKHDLNFSAYGTPAESLCKKFASALKEEYGVIKGVTDREYINNSFHVPVYHPISIYEKLEIEAPYHKYCTGGSISYVELDGNARNNLDGFEKIVRYGIDLGISYLAINHPIDECECGYEGIIGDECPACGKKEGEVFIKRLRRVS